jgi:hypothetical protein
MIIDKLKKDVLFIAVDGSLGSSTDVECRLSLQSNIANFLKKQNLRVLTFSPIKKYGDINMIPYFGLDTGYVNESYNYSFFMLKHLYSYIHHLHFSHICIWQTDGYPINLNNWDDIFLQYDYIGYNNGETMNGGFSIRSRKFMLETSSKINTEIISDFYNIYGHYNEDVVSQSLGISVNFPSNTIKNKFCKKIDNNHNINEVKDSFGFHYDGLTTTERITLFNSIKTID